MIFTKEDVSTSDDQVEKLTWEYNIHYRSCIGSLIYILSTGVDLSFAVHKLAKFSAAGLLKSGCIQSQCHMSIYYKYAPDGSKIVVYLMLMIFSIGIQMKIL